MKLWVRAGPKCANPYRVAVQSGGESGCTCASFLPSNNVLPWQGAKNCIPLDRPMRDQPAIRPYARTVPPIIPAGIGVILWSACPHVSGCGDGDPSVEVYFHRGRSPGIPAFGVGWPFV